MMGLADKFKSGQILIFPTDTLYGIGCVQSNPKAINRLYRIKKRERSKPTLILAANLDQAEKYAEFSSLAKQVAESFWPGPLTIVLKSKRIVSDLIQGPGKTVAIRVPDLPALQALIAEIGEPVLAPSANFAGQPPPKKANEIDSSLRTLVDYTIDSVESDTSPVEEPSTILDLSGLEPKIVREGAVDKKKLISFLER